VQRFGISDLLDWFADKANNIAGFRMFTVIIGVQPDQRSECRAHGGEHLRAAVEFMPGGHLIVEALDKYGVFEKAAPGSSRQVATLGMAGSMFIDALKKFIDSLSWTDIFPPGPRVGPGEGALPRADPQAQSSSLSDSATGIIKLIKEAISSRSRSWRKERPAWDLLLQVLGENPINGEKVPQSAYALIGGFMKMIGQEEIWNNIKKANADLRARSCGSRARSAACSPSCVPCRGCSLTRWRSLEIMTSSSCRAAFIKVGKAFPRIAGKFFSVALQQVLSCSRSSSRSSRPVPFRTSRRPQGAFTRSSAPGQVHRPTCPRRQAGLRQLPEELPPHLRKSIHRLAHRFTRRRRGLHPASG